CRGRSRSWTYEQRGGGQPNPLSVLALAEEGVVILPDLEAQTGAVAVASDAVVGTGVADVADHLSTIDVPAHGDTAGEAREVAVTQDRAARCAQPHLATAELVELLLGGAVRDVLHEYVPDAGRHLDVSGICPYDLGICRSDDGS